MSELVIRQIPALRDNYVYLAHDPETGATGVVDPAVAEPVLRTLTEAGWRLTHILNTHHHADHTGANLEIKAATRCTVVGPRADRDRIPGIDVEVGEGETYALGAQQARGFDVPGHTRGHIAYWFAGSRAAGKPTVPGPLGEEIATNPFLRADQPEFQAVAGAPGDAIATFAAIRRRKDNF
jgi:hydroxyacylglutathione hydrolase